MDKIMECSNNEALLTFILRTILGILFLFQGYDKIFKVKITGVVESFQFELGTVKIYKWILSSCAFFTSYVEFIGGILLILGLFKTYALYLLGIDLIIVTVAFSMIKPMWDMQFLFPRLILLGILLYLPCSQDILSLDYLLSIE